jgi:hypothetical protein
VIPVNAGVDGWRCTVVVVVLGEQRLAHPVFVGLRGGDDRNGIGSFSLLREKEKKRVVSIRLDVEASGSPVHGVELPHRQHRLWRTGPSSANSNMN